MHDQVGIRDACMDFLDALDSQDVTGRRACELVCAMAGTDGDRQGVTLGILDELGGLFGVGQQLVMRQHALGAGTVFLASHTRFQ